MSPIRRVKPKIPSPRSPHNSIYTPTYRRARRRRVAGWVLVGLGAIMAIVHMATHLGRLHILGYQDLLIGYPMSAALVFAGFILVGSVAKV